jgi:hypothetical protein
MFMFLTNLAPKTSSNGLLGQKNKQAATKMPNAHI